MSRYANSTIACKLNFLISVSQTLDESVTFNSINRSQLLLNLLNRLLL